MSTRWAKPPCSPSTLRRWRRLHDLCRSGRPPMSRPTEAPMSRPPASEALARFKVLDLTRVRAGPTCVRQLADWGADVIKIEMPEGNQGGDMGGPRHGPDFQNLHRNKRSMTLDLKQPEGAQVFRKMVKSADVVVENYRPDVKFRLGV